jgi:selenocysteine-specific elongation factor
MPQTREHLDILDVLGVPRLVVALTKVDVADEETALLAEEEVRSMLAGTPLEGAPIVRVSSVTGQGLDDLRAAIAAALPPPRDADQDPRSFRMPVLRGFVAAGRGAVLTGIPVAGRIGVGDLVEVLPPGWTGRVREIQVHKRPAEEAVKGQRTALALSDVTAEEVKRGMTVVKAGTLSVCRRVAARLRLLPGPEGVEHGERVRLHVGSDQVVARLHLLEGPTLAPGETGAVEIETAHDVAAAPGDRFVLRAENASRTLGGGVVVQTLERRLPRKRKGIVQSLLELASRLDDPEALLAAELRAVGERGTRAEDVARRTGLLPEALAVAMAALAARGEAVRLGHDESLWLDRASFDAVLERTTRGLEALHVKDPALETFPVSAVRSAAGRVEEPVLDAALQRLLAAGTVVRDGAGLRLASHRSTLSARDRDAMERVSAALAEARGQPPPIEDLAAGLGLAPRDAQRALKLLENRGDVFKATPELWFHAGWIADAKERLRAHAKEHGPFTASDARTLLDTTRKWVIPLLEALDKSGFTRRAGDRRTPRE